jgi:hypothetical protein
MRLLTRNLEEMIDLEARTTSCTASIYVIFFAIQGSVQHFHQRSVQFNSLTKIMHNGALPVMAASIKADLITGNDGRI